MKKFLLIFLFLFPLSFVAQPTLSHADAQIVVRRAMYPPAGGFSSPTDVSGLQVWLKADVGLTLNTTPYSGTGTVDQAGNIVTGTGTAFKSEVAIGDTITATGISGTVVSITNDLSLTLSSTVSTSGGAFTITPVSPGRVSAWADQSGNGKNAAQATPKNQPLKILSVQNSLPGVLANSNGDVTTQINQFMSTASITHGIGTGDFYIIVAAIRHGDVGAWQAIVSPNDATFGGPFWETTASNNFGFDNSGAHAFTGVAATATPYIIEFWRASGTVHLRVNGVDDATTTSATNTVPNGSFELFNDDGAADSASSTYLLEVCFYNSLPSGGNQTNLRNYMNGRWAIF